MEFSLWSRRPDADAFIGGVNKENRVGVDSCLESVVAFAGYRTENTGGNPAGVHTSSSTGADASDIAGGVDIARNR